MNKQGYIYILFNKRNGTLYIGVTSNLVQRIYEHKHELFNGFSARYGLNQLAYYEVYDSIVEAIKREKQLKKYYRKEKLDLIESQNPDWIDLYSQICL